MQQLPLEKGEGVGMQQLPLEKGEEWECNSSHWRRGRG